MGADVAHGCGKRSCLGDRRDCNDATHSGRPVKHDAQRIITLTTTTQPAQATDWGRTLMAQAAQVSPSIVGRIWRRHDPKLASKLAGIQFAEKLNAVVGLYLAPLEGALVLCVDEKNQIQALDRTQAHRTPRPGAPVIYPWMYPWRLTAYRRDLTARAV